MKRKKERPWTGLYLSNHFLILVHPRADMGIPPISWCPCIPRGKRVTTVYADEVGEALDFAVLDAIEDMVDSAHYKSRFAR